MNQHRHTPGRYALFSYLKSREMDKDATFCDPEALADSQLERAFDLRNCGLPIAGLGLQERIKYSFLQNFLPFWIK